jgi:hypothetical protein
LFGLQSPFHNNTYTIPFPLPMSRPKVMPTHFATWCQTYIASHKIHSSGWEPLNWHAHPSLKTIWCCGVKPWFVSQFQCFSKQWWTNRMSCDLSS